MLVNLSIRIFIFIIIITALLYADLPSEKYFELAFDKNNIKKWKNAIGFLDISLVTEKVYKLQKLPDSTSKVLSEFKIYSFVMPGNYINKKSDYISNRMELIKQLPFFISGFGMADEIPGFLIS